MDVIRWSLPRRVPAALVSRGLEVTRGSATSCFISEFPVIVANAIVLTLR